MPESRSTTSKLVDPRFRSALRIATLLWAFGYAFAAVLGIVGGRGRLPHEFFAMAPLCAAAVGLAGALYWLTIRLAARARLVTVIVLALVCVVFGALQTAIDLTYLFVLAQVAPEARKVYVPFDWQRFVSISFIYCWTFCLNAALFWAVGEGEKAKQAEAAASAAELAALRLQLNPHFLFNTLTAISSLVRTGEVETADRMIRRLSEFLRCTLRSGSDARSTLKAELDTIDAYLEIEAMRFEGRLQVEFDCDRALDLHPTPSFILQPLIENAMKYAVAPSTRPVKVAVRTRREGDEVVLEVRDDGSAPPPEGGSGIGLVNVGARLRAIYGRRASLITRSLAPGFLAQIRLPWAQGHSPLRAFS